MMRVRTLKWGIICLATGLALSGIPAAHAQAGLQWSPGSSSIREKEEFPPAFRGKWTQSSAQCADAEGVDAFHIYPDGVETYESGGRLIRITQSGEERTVLARIEFEGEGSFWDANWTLALGEDGRSLTLSQTDIVEDSSDYIKCGAGEE